MAQLAAENRTDQDCIEIEKALIAHRKRCVNNESAIDEDFMFHLKIAEASKNSVLKSLMLIITPEIMQYFRVHDVCGEGRAEVATMQHEELLQHIIERNPIKAGESLRQHLKEIIEYVKKP